MKEKYMNNKEKNSKKLEDLTQAIEILGTPNS